MNTASAYHSHLLDVTAALIPQGTVTAEAAGSSPFVPAIFFKHLQF